MVMTVSAEGAPATLAELATWKFNPAHWRFFIGVDPARAPDGDWYAVSVNGVPVWPSITPWHPILFWCGERRGLNMVDAARDLVSGPLSRFRSFHTMIIDRTHDAGTADMLAERYPRRIEAPQWTSELKEMMWKDYYMCLKNGRNYPGKTIDERLNRSVSRLREQVDRYQVSLTPTGKIKLSHRKKEHDDLLDADMMSVSRALRFMQKVRIQAGEGGAMVGHAPEPEERLIGDYGNAMARMYANMAEDSLLA